MPSKRDPRAAKTSRAATKKSTVGKTAKPASPGRTTQRAKGRAKGEGEAAAGPRGVLRRAATTVKKALARVTGGAKAAAKDVQPAKAAKGRTSARATKRTADIPMDRIAQTYTPTQTSLKAPFRTSGADQQRDQEFGRGVTDDRWNDEDRLTNRSGDPRIGTHGRSYEPGEARAASGRNRNDK